MHSFIPKNTHKVPVSRHRLDRSVSTSTQVDKGQDNQVMISTIKEPSLKFMNNLCMELNQVIFNPPKFKARLKEIHQLHHLSRKYRSHGLNSREECLGIKGHLYN